MKCSGCTIIHRKEPGHCVKYMIDNLSAFNLDGTVAVAVSGGADSMALMSLMRQTYANVVALTVDHQLRFESRQEAEQVAVWMAAWGVEHTILTWNEPSHQRLQERARQARYQLMGQWCKERGINTLMTAHHQDDKVETYWMRVFKGSGLTGLCSIQAERSMPFGRLIRPALTISREELRQALDGHSYIDDPSNHNTQFERVRVRQWLEANPDMRETALQSMRQLQADEAFIRELAYIAYNVCAKDFLPHYVKLHWQSVPPTVTQRMWKRVISEVGKKPHPISYDLAARVDNALRNGQAITAGGLWLRPTQEGVLLQVERDPRQR